MRIYEITLDMGDGRAYCATRKRKDAAALAWAKFVYHAAEAQGLRDRQPAHDAMAKREDIERFGALPHFTRQARVGQASITISGDTI